MVIVFGLLILDSYCCIALLMQQMIEWMHIFFFFENRKNFLNLYLSLKLFVWKALHSFSNA